MVFLSAGLRFGSAGRSLLSSAARIQKKIYISSNMPKTKHNNDRSVSRHGTGQKAAKKGGGGGSELIMS